MASAEPTLAEPTLGWRFSTRKATWVPVVDAEPSMTTCHAAIRIATLNCLHDLTLPEVLQHETRQHHICRELLPALDADVIALNEVTRPLLERLLQEAWVRESYTVSAVPDDPRCSHLSAVKPGSLGNVLLSRLPAAAVAYVDQLGDGRHSHVMALRLGDAHGNVLRVAVCSVHLTAFPWLMEGRRKAQLEHVTSALTAAVTPLVGDCDVRVLLGDFNFHREAENASIPAGWAEVPAVVALGATWDFARNPLLAHYLPLRNLYNGFGLGASVGWPSPMRLDRVLVHGTALDCAAASARLFADEPIHERARGRPPLPQTGPELREAHRALPWQEYLLPSDHFGICVELPRRPVEVL